METCNSFTTILPPAVDAIEVIGEEPIEVQKINLTDRTQYRVRNTATAPVKGDDGQSATIAVGNVTQGDTAAVSNSGNNIHAVFDFVLPKGKDGVDGIGKQGDPGLAGVIKIGKVTSGTTASVSNSGTPNIATLDFVLPKGDPGKDGTDGSDGADGLTKGISQYIFSSGNSGGSLFPMGNFTQGCFIDLGDSPSPILRKVRIAAWVTVGNMQNWTTLRLTSGSSATYSGSHLLADRVKHSEGQLYTGQYEIKFYVETTDRYIGFTFADNPGTPTSSDGSQYGDYGLEVFILS